MSTSNPVLERAARSSYAGFNDRATVMDTASVTTLDGVMMKTCALFAVSLIFAVPAWFFAPAIGTVLVLGAIVASLVLGLIISFMKTVSIPLILVFASVEGVLIGSVSSIYSQVFDESLAVSSSSVFQGIVAQAILATVCVFAAMLFLYTTRIIKVTQRFRAVVSMAVLGYMLFALVNLGYALLTDTQFGIGGSGPLGMLISIFAIGLASLTLMLDFDSIETAINNNVPDKYEWLLGIGLLVTLVWLYLEILRLLGRLRSN